MTASPCIFVVFGAGGDLARTKVFPALFSLRARGLLPDELAVVGSDREPRSDEDFRGSVRECLGTAAGEDEEAWRGFAERLHHVAADLAEPSAESCRSLRQRVDGLVERLGIPANLVFYLSIPPGLFASAARMLDRCGLARGASGWRRLVVEKPFGADAESSRALDAGLREVFDEESIYRIDHFLGKDTVQNMMLFRSLDPLFEAALDRHHVDHVQITVAEREGIGTRGRFYDDVGVVRDMLQNHLLQLLCLAAMEPPLRLDQEAVGAEALKVLDAVRPVRPGDWVLGQYGPGRAGERDAAGYRDENGIDAGSTTATFVACRLFVDTLRWTGVPFYLRTGKRMPRDVTEVTLRLARPALPLLPAPESGESITFRMKPDEGVVRTFLLKEPGTDAAVRRVDMDFVYREAFEAGGLPDAYENLLLDVVEGDRLMFARPDWIHRAWQVVAPILEAGAAPRPYAAGAWGPEESDALVQGDGRAWWTTTPRPGLRVE